MNTERKGRKHSRVKFAYPVEFNLFSPNLLSKSFTGHMIDMSVSGASIEFEDRYGRFKVIELRGSKIELLIRMSHGQRITINASINWVKKEEKTQNAVLLMGIEFEELDGLQLDQINKFLKLKEKDHKMMWNLYDYYLHQDKR